MLMLEIECDVHPCLTKHHKSSVAGQYMQQKHKQAVLAPCRLRICSAT
jgi:hypothetical protein